MTPESRLVPEMYCLDFEQTIKFYTEILDFEIEFSRPEDSFAMLNYQGARMMYEPYDFEGQRKWKTAPLEYPFGRGLNLQIDTDEADQMYQRILDAGITPFMPIEDKWYRVGDGYVGVRQFVVQDPNGFLLRFSEERGERAELPQE